MWCSCVECGAQHRSCLGGLGVASLRKQTPGILGAHREALKSDWVQSLDNRLTMSNRGRRYLCRGKRKSKPTMHRYRRAEADKSLRWKRRPPGTTLRPKGGFRRGHCWGQNRQLSRWLEKVKGLTRHSYGFKASSERAERHQVLAGDLMVKHLRCLSGTIIDLYED